MTQLVENHKKRREKHILTLNTELFAKRLAEAIWLACHFGFPSNSLTTPDNSRSSDNPNTPYNRNGTIIESVTIPTFIFGNQITVCFSMCIGRDDWFALSRELPEDSLILKYLDRPTTGGGKAPSFEHSRNRDQLWAWEGMLEVFLSRGLCKIELDVEKSSQV